MSEFRSNPPAAPDELASIPALVPQAYVDFLSRANGGEGFIGDEYVVLWKASEVRTFNDDYQVPTYAPGYLLIGTNGGGEGFGFDTRSSDPRPVLMLPLIGMEPQHAKPIAADFDRFIAGEHVDPFGPN